MIVLILRKDGERVAEATFEDLKKMEHRGKLTKFIELQTKHYGRELCGLERRNSESANSRRL